MPLVLAAALTVFFLLILVAMLPVWVPYYHFVANCFSELASCVHLFLTMFHYTSLFTQAHSYGTHIHIVMQKLTSYFIPYSRKLGNSLPSSQFPYFYALNAFKRIVKTHLTLSGQVLEFALSIIFYSFSFLHLKSSKLCLSFLFLQCNSNIHFDMYTGKSVWNSSELLLNVNHMFINPLGYTRKLSGLWLNI